MGVGEILLIHSLTPPLKHPYIPQHFWIIGFSIVPLSTTPLSQKKATIHPNGYDMLTASNLINGTWACNQPTSHTTLMLL